MMHTGIVPMRVQRLIFFFPPSSSWIFFSRGNTIVSSCMMIDIEM